MIAEIASAFVVIATLTFTDGTERVAEGEAWPSYDMCMMQAEADAKLMDHEAQRLEEAGIVNKRMERILVRCIPMPAGYEPHAGYIPLEKKEARRAY